MSAAPSKSRKPLFKFLRGCLIFGGILGLLAFLLALPVIMQGQEEAISSKACLHALHIQQALEKYAVDHHAHFPDGKSSTAIFQALIDEHYVEEPSLFYFPMSGKTKPETNHLTPENVCWDVTSGIDSDSPDDLPSVFATGYKVSYVAGGTAKSLAPTPFFYHIHMPLSTKGDSCTDYPVSSDGTVPRFIPADFEAKGKIYRQLTPDGELPP